QDEPVFADVVETSEKWTNERRARLCRENRLRCRETKCDVYFDSFIRQLACGFETIASQRALDHDIRRDLRILTSFTNHAVFVLARHFSRDRSLNDLADRGDVLFEVDTTFLRDECRISRHSIGKTQRSSFANLVEIGGIK